MKLNRNQVLIAIGLLAAEGPDVAAVAAWLPTLGIPHLTGLIHILGTISLTLGGLALAWPRIRSLLAAGGLATPPGAIAPWDPTKDAGPAKPASTLPKIVPVLIFLGASLFTSAALAQDVPPTPQLGFKIGQWTTCQPATAGGVQINLKTGNWQRFVFAQGFGCTYRGWTQPVGAAAYIGYGVVADAPNAYQGALLFSYADAVATGPGVQVFKDPVDGTYISQVTWSLVGNFNWGASVTKLGTELKATKAEARRQVMAERMGAEAGK